MGKLKEKLLNNLSENEMDEQFELSAFEYVELVERYKDKKEDEYVPTDDEMQKLEQMVQDYYNSKEFREYVENYEPTNEDGWTEEMEKQYWEEQPPYPFATQNELDEINDSLKVKFTEDEVIEAVRSIKNEDWFIAGIRRELNVIWNRKNGVI
jgi:hypothetical protein